MSHQDLHARGVRTNSADLRRALQWLISGVDWTHLKLRGDCSWSCQSLAWVALCWAWSAEVNLTARFDCAQRLVRSFFDQSAQRATSYQAFMKLLRRWTDPLIDALRTGFRKRMASLHEDGWTTAGYIAFAVDGSKIDVPRTKSHQSSWSLSRADANSRKRNRRLKPQDKSATKKAEHPSLFLTTMYHIGLRLPWDWRIGPADSSERAHTLQMLPALPSNSILVADAGFVGYDFTQSVLDQSFELLIRVGSNLRLLKKLGYARESSGTVYVWPEKACRGKLPPLVFRLVTVQATKHPVHLLTSVAKSRLSDRQVAQLYRERWGIEVFYRSFKQTFGRRKLRSLAAENAVVELHWSMMGLSAIGLYASRELASQQIAPAELSLAAALQAFRNTARDYLHPRKSHNSLNRQLQSAVKDSYTRDSKTSRDYPRKKRESPPSPPTIRIATRKQRQAAAEIKELQKG